MIMTPEQYPAIWSQIIGYLKRPSAPPWAHRRIEWSELHQHELTVVSRVCSTFHELATPHLYTSVIVNDLKLFCSPLASLSEKPLQSSKHKTTSHRDKLALIKHLWLPLLWPRSQNHSLAGQGPFTTKVIENLWQNLEPQITLARDYAELKILAGLETMTIGHSGHSYWDTNIMTHRLGGNIRERYSECWDALFIFIAKCAPRSVCFHDCIPEDWRVDPSISPLPKVNVTIHAQVLDAPDGIPSLWRGLNRFLEGPSPSTRLREPSGLAQILNPLGAGLLDVWRLIGGDTRARQDGMAFEICGLYDVLPDESSDAEDPDTSHDTDPKNAPESGESSEEHRRRMKTLEVERWMHESWKGHFKFVSAAETAPCETCGWTIEDGWKTECS